MTKPTTAQQARYIHTARNLAALRARITAWRSGPAEVSPAERVAATNAGRLTVAMFLTYLGMEAAEVAKVESQFGKLVAAAYRAANNGQDPAQTGAALVRGKVFYVNAYRWDELGLLTSVAIAHPAVRPLIGA